MLIICILYHIVTVQLLHCLPHQPMWSQWYSGENSQLYLMLLSLTQLGVRCWPYSSVINSCCIGCCITGALSSMQQSSAEAARILKDHGATACTDVTGFGLVGHLVEMTRPSQA